MDDLKVTLAALKSVLKNPEDNLKLVIETLDAAKEAGARIVLFPELMLTGHGGHPRMYENAEPVPQGPLSSEIVRLSGVYDMCICVGIAQLNNYIVYNSQMVADKGKYLGLQRKIHLSGDEYCYFGAGTEVEVFDIGDARFGISICYDCFFPELFLAHSINNVDLILAPHAARYGNCPDDSDLCKDIIRSQQDRWEMVYRARAYDHNVYLLFCNAAGSSTEGLNDVVANHAGTLMVIDPSGDVVYRSDKKDFSNEIKTFDILKDKRRINHSPARNRKLHVFERYFK